MCCEPSNFGDKANQMCISFEKRPKRGEEINVVRRWKKLREAWAFFYLMEGEGDWKRLDDVAAWLSWVAACEENLQTGWWCGMMMTWTVCMLRKLIEVGSNFLRMLNGVGVRSNTGGRLVRVRFHGSGQSVWASPTARPNRCLHEIQTIWGKKGGGVFAPGSTCSRVNSNAKILLNVSEKFCFL